ncbi:unnamed protein product [Cunninghamella blakesleeana]
MSIESMLDSDYLEPKLKPSMNKKRSLISSEYDDRLHKHRKYNENQQQQQQQQKPLEKRKTIVTCLHAAVAQKSYGSEKRFLCPPPIISLQHEQENNENTHSTLDHSIFSMSVITEGNNHSNNSNNNSNEKPVEQRTTLDENKNGSFKYLHVTGTAKTKQFCLRVNMNHSMSNNNSSSSSMMYPPFATFFSSPISIISKPSKKTSKARNVSTCVFTTSQISLFNRINSQTVRTKYLTSEKDQLCAKNAAWTPFDIILVRQPTSSAQNALSQNHHHYHHHHQPSITTAGVPLTYGTEIILKDAKTGCCSPNLIIRKVDKSCISHSATGPVSQMQKIALQLASTVSSSSENKQQPLYLSANGRVMTDASSISNTLVDNNNNNNNSNNNNNNNNNNQEENNSNGNGSNHTHSSTWLDYSPSKYLNDNNNNKNENENGEFMTEMVNDYLCWTIIGICKFEYTIEEPIMPPTSTMMTHNSSNSSFSSTSSLSSNSSLSSQTSSPTLQPISPLLSIKNNTNNNSFNHQSLSPSPSSSYHQFKQYSHPHHDISTRTLQPSPPPSPPRTIIPFPMVSSVKYQNKNHTLQIIGQHLIQHLPTSTHSQLLEFWLGGAHGPLRCSYQHTPSSSFTQGNGNIELDLDLPNTQDFLVSHHDLLRNQSNGDRAIELPLLMVRKDNVVYHSGKAIVCHVRSNGDTHWSILDATVAK